MTTSGTLAYQFRKMFGAPVRKQSQQFQGLGQASAFNMSTDMLMGLALGAVAAVYYFKKKREKKS